MSTSQFLTILFIAVSCNLDNVCVGLAYGARGIRIPLASNLLIAAVTAGGTGLCMVFGHQAFRVLPPQIGSVLGALLLVVMGVWIIQQEAFRGRAKPEKIRAAPSKRSRLRRLFDLLADPILADRDFSGHIDLRESLVLSMALMLNNIPNGVGAGLLALSPAFMVGAVFLLSLLTFRIGLSLGRTVGARWLGSHAGTVSGLLLVAVGIVEIALSVPIRT
jgi:putative sporulation protein YtaF